VSAAVPALLLKELQKQAAQIRTLKLQLMRDRQLQISELKELKEALRVALAKSQTNAELVARR
jgi:hypothetical protein